MTISLTTIKNIFERGLKPAELTPGYNLDPWLHPWHCSTALTKHHHTHLRPHSYFSAAPQSCAADCSHGPLSGRAWDACRGSCDFQRPPESCVCVLCWDEGASLSGTWPRIATCSSFSDSPLGVPAESAEKNAPVIKHNLS